MTSRSVFRLYDIPTLTRISHQQSAVASSLVLPAFLLHCFVTKAGEKYGLDGFS